MSVGSFFISQRLKSFINEDFKNINKAVKKNDIDKSLYNDIGRVFTYHYSMVGKDDEWSNQLTERLMDTSILYQVLYKEIDRDFRGLIKNSTCQMRSLIGLTVDEINGFINDYENMFEKAFKNKIYDYIKTRLAYTYREVKASSSKIRDIERLSVLVADGLESGTLPNEHPDYMNIVTKAFNAALTFDNEVRGMHRNSIVCPYILFHFTSNTLKDMIDELMSEGFNNIRNEAIQNFLQSIRDVFFAYGYIVYFKGRQIDSIKKITSNEKDNIISDYFIDCKDFSLLKQYQNFVFKSPYSQFDHNPKRVINFIKLKTGLKHDN